MDNESYSFETTHYLYYIPFYGVLLALCIWIFTEALSGNTVEGLVGWWAVSAETLIVISGFASAVLLLILSWSLVNFIRHKKEVTITEKTLKIDSPYLFQSKEVKLNDLTDVTFEEENLLILVEVNQEKAIEFHADCLSSDRSQAQARARQMVKQLNQKRAANK